MAILSFYHIKPIKSFPEGESTLLVSACSQPSSERVASFSKTQGIRSYTAYGRTTVSDQRVDKAADSQLLAVQGPSLPDLHRPAPDRSRRGDMLVVPGFRVVEPLGRRRVLGSKFLGCSDAEPILVYPLDLID